MKISKISLVYKKAPFASVMTMIFFIMFTVVYLSITVLSIEPYYFKGLLFAIPFGCFGVIAFLTVTGKNKIVTSFSSIVILSIVLGFASMLAFVFIALDAATTVTTDVDKYERVLKLTGYPNNSLIKYFPDEIPNNAKNIKFSYNPAFLQGSENYDLKFETNSGAIENYINQFSNIAKWTGKLSDIEAKTNGVLLSDFDFLDYNELPEDFTIYLINSMPYEQNNWNHGEIGLVAISKQKNEIIFMAEDW